MPRSLYWTAALRDLKSDRGPVRPGFAGALAMAGVYTKTRELPFVVAGQYDRSAIMHVAAIVAKNHQARYGSTWAEAMSIALKGTWQLAKAARARTAH